MLRVSHPQDLFQHVGRDADVSPINGGMRTTRCTIEIEGAERPALVADFIFMAMN